MWWVRPLKGVRLRPLKGVRLAPPMLAHEGPQEHTCDPLMTLRGAHVILIFNHYHRRDIRDAETAVADAICIIPECECGRLWRLRKPAQEQIPQQLCTPSEYCLELHAEMLMWRPLAVGEEFRYGDSIGYRLCFRSF